MSYGKQRMPKTSTSWVVVLKMIRLRKARGWSVQRVVDEFNAQGHVMTHAVLQGLEVGRRNALTIDEAIVLTKIFNVSITDLINTECERCDGSPPAGFQCRACGAEADS